MAPIDLLQQIGLNKYEAEAYYALLATGPLTGYELGKRSQVPLSRSYEILERLLQRGLAVVQPGDPPRYAAEEPARFLGRVRDTLTGALDALTEALAALTRPDIGDEFWVVRGRSHILARVQALLVEARQSIALNVPAAVADGMDHILAAARERGCRVWQGILPPSSTPQPEIVLLLVDDRLALAGVLSPAEHCQAVCSANPALVSVARRFFSGEIFIQRPMEVSTSSTVEQAERADWVAWETRKQQQLWRLATGGRVA